MHFLCVHVCMSVLLCCALTPSTYHAPCSVQILQLCVENINVLLRAWCVDGTITPVASARLFARHHRPTDPDSEHSSCLCPSSLRRLRYRTRPLSFTLYPATTTRTSLNTRFIPNVDMSSPVPPSPSVSGPRPLQLVDGNLQLSPAVSPCPSPTVSGLSTPPPSAHKYNPRRQSSISYYPSDHTPSWELRSPTTPGPSSLRRSTSLNQKAPARLTLKGDRRSLPVHDVVVEAERPPLTLTEKYVCASYRSRLLAWCHRSV